MCKSAGRTCVERNDACGAPKGEDYTSLIQVSHMSDEKCRTTYQYNIRECEEEKWPLEVLPVSRFVFRLVVPQLQLLQQRALFIPREHFARTFGSSGMCRSETLCTIFLVGRLTHIVNNRSVLSVGKLVVLVEQKAWEHGPFEAAEDQKERSGFNNCCDPTRPTPAASVCNGSSGDEPETVIGSVNAMVT